MSDAAMTRAARRLAVALIYAFFGSMPQHSLWANDLGSLESIPIESMEFRNRPLADIVTSLGVAAGLALTPDESIDGNASWYFPKGSLADALTVFLAQNRLYATESGGAWEVSRVSVSSAGGITSSLDVDDAPLPAVARILSRKVGFTLSGERLPEVRLSIHGFSGGVGELIATLLAFAPEYAAAERGATWRISRVSLSGQSASVGYPELSVEEASGLWSARINNRSFGDAIATIADRAGFEYSMLWNGSAVIKNLSVTGRNLEELVSIACAQAGADYAVKDGLWYFVELSQRDVVRGVRETKVVPLTYITANDAIALLPPDWLAGNLFKTDQKNNAFVLNGTHGDIGNFERYVAEIDRPIPGRSWVRFDLKNQRVKTVLPKIPQGYGQSEAVVLEDQNSVLLPLPADAVGRVRALIAEIDKAVPVQTIELRYLSVEELLKRLPPSVQKDELVEAASAKLFFVGPEQRFRQVTEDIKKIDVPSPQIRYQVLVVEYRKGDSLSVDGGVSGSSSGSADAIGFTGSLSGVLDLSVDVVSAFGITFATALSGKITDERARVLADTTLQGLSGQDVKFQNTSTYRYNETKIDDETGDEITTGVVHEITSGLIIGLNGWVSGDDMITLAMNTTISKRGGEGTDDARSTTERVLSTRVRTPSGKPLVVGGLVQRTDEKTRSGVPFLSSLPLIGRLFGGHRVTTEDTELTIYIIPFVEYGLTEGDERARIVSGRIAADADAIARAARQKLAVPEGDSP